jgi:ornithine decarboxylase
MNAIIEKVNQIIDKRLAVDNDEPFYLLNTNDVKEKFINWMKVMPRVVPFYAIKCNDDDRIARTLAELGAGFDCASKKEIAQVLALNVDNDKIVFSHTAKQVSYLKYAAENQIDKLTFDSEAELLKIKEHYPNARVVLRIRFDAATSIINLGIKFGCDRDLEAPKLIKLCMKLKMNLYGISFHVGSGTQDFGIFPRALEAVRRLFDFAATLGFSLKLVDIGGGFIGADRSLLQFYADSINEGIDKYFPDPSVEIISEPGRYFVDSALTLATQVVMKKIGSDGQYHYYLNDGIYRSFLIAFLYEEILNFTIIRKSNENEICKENKLSTIWGCSCNSKDKVLGDKMIPELNIGDWIVFHNMGAYTNSVSTSFNGFKIGEIIAD